MMTSKVLVRFLNVNMKAGPHIVVLGSLECSEIKGSLGRAAVEQGKE